MKWGMLSIPIYPTATSRRFIRTMSFLWQKLLPLAMNLFWCSTCWKSQQTLHKKLTWSTTSWNNSGVLFIGRPCLQNLNCRSMKWHRMDNPWQPRHYVHAMKHWIAPILAMKWYWILKFAWNGHAFRIFIMITMFISMQLVFLPPLRFHSVFCEKENRQFKITCNF